MKVDDLSKKSKFVRMWIELRRVINDFNRNISVLENAYGNRNEELNKKH